MLTINQTAAEIQARALSQHGEAMGKPAPDPNASPGGALGVTRAPPPRQHRGGPAVVLQSPRLPAAGVRQAGGDRRTMSVPVPATTRGHPGAAPATTHPPAEGARWLRCPPCAGSHRAGPRGGDRLRYGCRGGQRLGLAGFGHPAPLLHACVRDSGAFSCPRSCGSQGEDRFVGVCSPIQRKTKIGVLGSAPAPGVLGPHQQERRLPTRGATQGTVFMPVPTP